MSQVSPPGWYPDEQDAASLRYWDGQVWTDARTPVLAPRVGVLQPDLPSTTRANTPFIWALVLLPIVTMVAALVWAFTFDPASIAVPSVSEQTGIPTQVTANSVNIPGLQVLQLIGMLTFAAGIVLAFFDWRSLTHMGVVKPFHWSFAFIPSSFLVYVIGRTVVLRRRVRQGVAPMIVLIAMVVASVVVWVIVAVVIATAIFAHAMQSGDLSSAGLSS